MRETLLQSEQVNRLALLALLSVCSSLVYAGDSELNWRTVESAHFVVHYYEPNEDIARRVAVVAERAHRVLAPALGHEPSAKTQIVVTDDTDSANGFASALPFNHIGLYATAPDSLSVLNDHDDWLYGLVAHEYSHILHLDTMGWIPRLYNRIFGKTWAPNNVQPRWFIEGLATYEESKRSSSGRVRSAIFDMYLRLPILAGTALDLDAVSTGPLRWPHGHTAYLYGSFFLAYLAERFGDEVIGKISHEYGAQPVPWGLNRAARRVTGQDFVTLYRDWLAALGERYRDQRATVAARGFVEGQQLTHTGEFNSVCRYTHDGQAIVWQSTDGYRAARYRRRPRVGPARDLLRFDSAGKFTLLPDDRGMVVERAINYRTSYGFTDLYRVDWDGVAVRLTHGARAAGPDLSPDGKWLAFTVNGRSRQRLALMPVDGSAAPMVVWEGARWDQAYDPAWSPDGHSIVFSAWTEGGFTDLYLYDVAAKTTRRLLADRALDVTPRFAPNGRQVYFASDRTGIYNIFALDLSDGSLKQVTNVLGGAFRPDISPDGKSLCYEGFAGEGYELYELALEPARFLPAEPYVDDRPPSTHIPDEEAEVSVSRPYRPAETLAPYVYTLSTTVDSYGSAVTVSTSGADIVGLYSWYLSATLGAARGDVSFGAAAYTNRFWPALGLAVGRSTGLAGGLIANGHNTPFHDEAWSFTASVGLPVLRAPEVSSDLSLVYDATWLRNLDSVPAPDPDAPVTMLPHTGLDSGITLRWSMSDVRGYAFSLGAVEGRGLSLALRFEHPDLGSSRTSLDFYWRWDQYWQLPLRHIFALRLAGAIGASEPGNANRYFLGGVPEQDIVQAILRSTRVGSGWLRGYGDSYVFGDQYHLLNLEYRVPIHDIEKGLATLPFYFRRLHLAALFDAGNAFTGPFRPADLRVAVGAVARLDMTFGFYVPGTFELGYARGLSAGGGDEFWFLLTGGI